MPELVTGATGYVGGRLIERLLREGREVRALARNPSKLEAPPEVRAVKGDLVTGRGLTRALDGVSVAYYLVHSMEPAAGSTDGDFASRDRSAAENFAHAAEAAGVERIVYLGGMVPSLDDGQLSPHLASRLEVERTLLDALPRSTALRASIVVGARSASFRILVRLVERMRVLPFPAWRDHRTQPIDERDAIEYLARTPFTPAAEGKSLDIAGPDLMSYGQMIERIADLMGVGRTPVRIGTSATPLASAVVSSIVDQPVELVRPLMYSLERDLLPRNDSARELYGFRIHSFDRAVEHALREWERREELAAR
jgi:uncharacterized protein YbjT (DUF2867 family)